MHCCRFPLNPRHIALLGSVYHVALRLLEDETLILGDELNNRARPATRRHAFGALSHAGTMSSASSKVSTAASRDLMVS